MPKPRLQAPLLTLLRDAIPSPERLEVLAIYFDSLDRVRGISSQTEVQDDLRRWAAAGRLALAALPTSPAKRIRSSTTTRKRK
jgi:hypothetical protein